ncbi:hypothetical protein D9757_002228 [Collybiopsis confluens]|uniref:Cryptic loci regulator 2 N-terminal domain-containing protein n=1 Tax=Collybiopsis confluens TaxID=2823264 RepID=A0A8H5HZW0_9AGAR|nr:hypothetical protein D9757_002228 [Collybiopsis confluens]
MPLTFIRTDATTRNWSLSERTTEAPVEKQRLWLKSISAPLAKALDVPLSSVSLGAFPRGYQLLKIWRGKDSGGNLKRRSDYSLKGSRHVQGGFRSANEFLPHAIWLIRDPTLNHARCECRFHIKRESSNSESQRLESQSVMSLVSDQYSDATSRRFPQRLDKSLTHSSPRELQTVLYGIRQGDTAWVALNPPISSSAVSGSIKFWPCIVEELLESRLGSKSEVRIKPFGPLAQGTQVVDESRILPHQAYRIPEDLVKALQTCVRMQTHDVSIRSINFEDVEYYFPPPQPDFDLIASSYVLALFEASENEGSWEIIGEPVSRLLDSTGEITIEPTTKPHMGESEVIRRCASFRWRLLATILPVMASGIRSTQGRKLIPANIRWLVEEPGNLRVLGALYELADQEDTDNIEADLPQAHHGYVFRRILSPNHMANISMNDMATRYYPAPAVISAFYSLNSRVDATLINSDLCHLQTLAGLWRESCFLRNPKFYFKSNDDGVSPSRKHILEFLTEALAISRENQKKFSEAFGFAVK